MGINLKIKYDHTQEKNWNYVKVNLQNKILFII